MNYEQLAREHHHSEVNLMRDVRVLLSAANHVLFDEQSTLYPLAKGVIYMTNADNATIIGLLDRPKSEKPAYFAGRFAFFFGLGATFGSGGIESNRRSTSRSSGVFCFFSDSLFMV